MIDLVCIFTTGGVILYYQKFCALKYDIVSDLITRNLINDRQDEKSYFQDPYRVVWKRSKKESIFYIVAYQEALHIQNIDGLLGFVKKAYIEFAYPKVTLKNNIYQSIPKFDNDFEQVINKWQQVARDEKKRKLMKSFADTDKAENLVKEKGTHAAKEKYQGNKNKKQVSMSQSEIVTNGQGVKSSESDEQFSPDPMVKSEVNSARDAMKNRFTGSNRKNKSTIEEVPVEEEKPKYQKKMSVKEYGKIDSKTMKSLDFTKNQELCNTDKDKSLYLGGNINDIQGFLSDNYSSEDDEAEKVDEKQTFFSKFTNSVKKVTGNKQLDANDLKPMLVHFKEGLMEKNVAEEVAQHLVDSVKTNLLNTKSQAFTSIKSIVFKSLDDALTKILTPKRHIDLIADAMRSREKGKPYVITFIGVNGVGKSTNLAKIAYLFKNQNFKVMLAACDNFRAGAVEQIKTHGRCLDIPVYDRGYREDPADIAFQAVREATLKKVDVLLIDTAGRMQDNEPLMRSLSRLVVLNQPDLILFVGEALVGNDATDQLMKFNKSLVDLSPKNDVREIDAIILSKFDTVDDKVGAAVSMTYNTGKPILFCGVGQKYIHLKKLNVKTIVHSLLY